MHRILIVKPYCVTISETEEFINKFCLRYPSANIELVANLFPDDYERINRNHNIDEKVLYGPHAQRLTNLELIKLILKLRKKSYDTALLLIGVPTQDNYRKGKLLIFFSGAKEKKLYFLKTGQELFLDPLGIKQSQVRFAQKISFSVKNILDFLCSSFMLMTIMIGFLIFMVFPMKIKKIFLR